MRPKADKGRRAARRRELNKMCLSEGRKSRLEKGELQERRRADAPVDIAAEVGALDTGDEGRSQGKRTEGF